MSMVGVDPNEVHTILDGSPSVTVTVVTSVPLSVIVIDVAGSEESK